MPQPTPVNEPNAPPAASDDKAGDPAPEPPGADLSGTESQNQASGDDRSVSRSALRPKTRFVSQQDPVSQEVGDQPPTTGSVDSETQPPTELTDEEWKERLEAERERITKENQRKLDQRNDRLAVARKKSAELNARFADWYYIVSDSEFKRLKIELSDLITTKGTSPQGSPSGLPGGIPGINIPGLPGG